MKKRKEKEQNYKVGYKCSNAIHLFAVKVYLD